MCLTFLSDTSQPLHRAKIGSPRFAASANILAALFPERFENLQEMHYSLMPGSGLLEQQSEEQFYLKLIELYQTSSLT